jgi:GH15 family glucan-1,4-alpha-glucosidase
LNRKEYQPIENYGVIGDLETVALVGMDASIDFMCFPHFDSPTIFAALLDADKGGHFQIAPLLDHHKCKQIYLPDSAILLSRFLSDDGIAEISDFMPLAERSDGQNLVRRAKTVRGEVRFRMRCAPRFDYGRAKHRIERSGNDVLFISEGAEQTALRLRGEVPMRVEGDDAVAEFTCESEKSAGFVLENASDGEKSSRPRYIANAFKETLNFWQNWMAKSRYKGRWREMVNRSALTLKLLTSRRHGSIVAAPTFGLPEEVGGARNWDYRFTWIRDASFSIYALMRLGYTDEATAFMRWIEERCRELEPGTPLNIMYRIDGSHEMEETILHDFDGYKGSRPVRIGNSAHRQLQLDVFGELLDAVYIYDSLEPISYDFWCNLVRLVDWVTENWCRPDEGIWEVRGGRHEFLYSRLMCWVAIDRGVRLARKRSFPAPLDRWAAVRDTIFRDIYENFWNAKRETFVQYKGADAVDAATLLMPIVKFIGSNDPRWRSTLKEINKRLVEDSLVYRYSQYEAANDGLPGREGTFSMCSFWNVECLARAGDLKQARFYFDKALGYANHLGLYSEELGLRGEQLGNFPQALTHMSLISAAHYLDESLAGQERE